MTSPLVKVARRALRWLVLVAALVGCVVTAVSALPGDAWWIALLDFPRLQFCAVLLVVLALLLALPGRGRPLTLAAIAAVTGAALWDAALLFPYVGPLAGPVPPPVVPDGACLADRRLRVLAVNVQMTNRHDDELLAMVRAADPDIAWFQETDAWWERELAPLSAAMPHGAAKIQGNYYGVHLFSKLPLASAEVRQLTGSHDPSVFATVTLPGGGGVALYALHPHPPLVGQSAAERDGQLMAAALAAHDDARPSVLMGDMNAVPWSGILARAERVGGFRDPRVGRGLFVTWNANRSLMKWPLDHILPGRGLSLQSLRVLPAFGSDHHPLLADLCLDPAEAAAAAPPTASAADLAAARETGARGPGQAAGPGAQLPLGTETNERD